MAMTPYSHRMESVLRTMERLLDFIQNSPWSTGAAAEDPEVCDFTLGNPHDMPITGYVQALEQQMIPRSPDWFGYKRSEERPRQVIASALSEHYGMPFNPEDILMTTGAFAGIAVTLNTLVEHGDEVVFNLPPWFFYEPMIANAGASPVSVRVNPQTFDLDLDAIRQALTPRTRAVIVNSPNNPTGRIYPPKTLERLANILTLASRQNRQTIYLISDESYSRIVYDEMEFPSPAQYYPDTIMVYTYGKTLLTPGQRIGYLALPPTMTERENLRQQLMVSQMVSGWAFPNAIMQHALPELEVLSVDISRLQARRDRMVSALRQIGYQVNNPEGTFYLLPRSPWEDDMAFVRLLAERKIYCLPGSVAEMPGYFRISLTATDEMVERSLPGFKDAFRQARKRFTHLRATRRKQKEAVSD